ncbi:MAG: hypothetical protein Q7S56_01615 [Nanoarchaeota archaeon]|nr:hypothetical protein [Nanoarchaeota archaeon]
MVKIEGLTKEDIQERDNYSRLVELTKELVGNGFLTTQDSSDYIGVYRGQERSPIIHFGNLIHPRVSVYSPVYFDMAVQLAKAYEGVLKEEVTVKKRYQE